MKKVLVLMLISFMSVSLAMNANNLQNDPIIRKTTIVGGGIVGAMESYFAFKEAEKNGEKICVTVYDKNGPFASNTNTHSTNTAYNIVPSLTIDEILCVVPRGTALAEKLTIHFSKPGGIRVDDVEGVNTSEAALRFKEAVAISGKDTNHEERTYSLLQLGKKSMNLWQQIYDEADTELKTIMEASNFNPCRNPTNSAKRVLHDGYRVDLIYGIQNADKHALTMKADYEKLGYADCALLTPDEVVAIDPYLADFCKAHSEKVGSENKRVWNNDAVGIWRPGGCIDAVIFLPKFYSYLQKVMGQYRDENNQVKDCFQHCLNTEVTAVEFDPKSDTNSADSCRIVGLQFKDGTKKIEKNSSNNCRYVFCPGEAVGTLKHFGFQEPAYAAFAGPSLFITIPLSKEQIEKYKNFSHCMEVHNEGIVLAWQARFIEDRIFIGVAGTKSFYGDKQPTKNEEFARNRNLVQLNMINNVLPEFISLACGYDTYGKTLSEKDLSLLESKGFASRWVGRRAVAYDNFPTLGTLYRNNMKVSNARCTTHLGSGGVSFSPAAVFMSRASEQNDQDAFVQQILQYADSRRFAK